MWYTLAEKEPEDFQDIIICYEDFSGTAFYSTDLGYWILRNAPMRYVVDFEKIKNCLWTPIPKRAAE